MRNLTFRIIMTLVVVFLSSAVLALSCNDAAKKLGDQLKNNNGDNSGGTGDKNLVDPSLTIKQLAPTTIVKMDASGNIKINAKTLAAKMADPPGPTFTMTNLVTLFNDDKKALPLFEVQLMRNSSTVAEGGFVVGGRTNGSISFTKSTLAFKNTADSLREADGRIAGTSDEVWRRSDTTGNFYQLISYSLVFNSGGSLIKALVVCPTGKMNGVTNGATAQDNTKLPFTKATCYLIQVGGAAGEIDEAWVDNAAAASSTTKDGVRYIGVYTGDTGLKDLSDAAGWTKASFFDALNNTALQAIFNKNKYVDKAFYIELLKDVDFKKP